MQNSNFDTLKREATKLERSLEDKVSRYQQLVQSIPENGPTNGTGAAHDLYLAESGMSSSAPTAGDEAALRHDIQRTLTNLQDLISGRLQPASEKAGSHSALMLVKRYREILFDLSGDFEKARQSYDRKQERAKLMAGARNTQETDGGDPAMEHLLRERNHIGNSLKAASSVIDHAMEVQQSLRDQGMSFGRVRAMMSSMAQNVPGINAVVEKIRRKKSKDDKILAGVIAFLILFTLYYLFGS